MKGESPGPDSRIPNYNSLSPSTVDVDDTSEMSSEVTPLRWSQPTLDIESGTTPLHFDEIVSPRNRQVASRNQSHSSVRRHLDKPFRDTMDHDKLIPYPPKPYHGTTADSPCATLMKQLNEGVAVLDYTQDSDEGISGRLFLTEDDVLVIYRYPRSWCRQERLFETEYSAITGFTTSVSIEHGIIVQAGATKCARFKILGNDDQVSELVDFLAHKEGSNGSGFLRFSQVEINRYLQEKKDAPLQPVKENMTVIYRLLGKLIAWVLSFPFVSIIVEEYNLGIETIPAFCLLLSFGGLLGITEYVSYIDRTADAAALELDMKVKALYSRWHTNQSNYEASDELKTTMLEFAEIYGLLPVHKRRGCIKTLSDNVEKMNKALDKFESDSKWNTLWSELSGIRRKLQELKRQIGSPSFDLVRGRNGSVVKLGHISVSN